MLRNIAILTTCLIAFAACSSAPKNTIAEAGEPDPRRGEEVNRICFASNIDSFGETTRNTVIIREGRDRYLVETFRGCSDLQFAQSLAIDARSSCLTRGDNIIGFNSAFGPSNIGPTPLRCMVNKIYRWNPDAEVKT
jgi:hypothetical protein